MPHCCNPPQPLPAGPQLMFCDAHEMGLQLGAPQWPGMPPPPHVCGATHGPQSSNPPHPLPAGPHVMFC
jgi:hypothetical protein